MRFSLVLSLIGCLVISAATAQERTSSYVIENIPLPPGEEMELVSVSLLPEDQVCVTTRRGEVWIGKGLYEADLSAVKWSLFARGLHDGFGSYWKDGSVHVLQKGELTKLTDSTGDGKADIFRTISDDWGLIHNIHEFAFGTEPDKNGDVWVTLCLTGSSRSQSSFRGWAVRITPEGKMIPTVSGIRSPGGVGFDAGGVAFYTDNQGHWNGSSSLKPLLPGTFVGNPTGNVWYDQAPEMGARPVEPNSGGRIVTERMAVDELVPPAVVFPHGEVGQSPTGITSDLSGGKFGPFQNQMFVGEITHSQVQRVMMEQVNGVYQGAVVNFLSGIDFGVVPVKMNQEKGVMLVGGTNRGWGSRGEQSFGLARVRWSGETPFAVHDIKATETGFRLNFTKPVDAQTVNSIEVGSFTYIYQSGYGSPVVDDREHAIDSKQLSDDGKTLELVVSDRVRGNVHRINLADVTDPSGQLLEHGDAFYTLNEIPGAPATGKEDWETRKAVFTGTPTESEKESLLAVLPVPSVKPKQPRRILCFYRCEGAVHKSIPYANEAMKMIGETTGVFSIEFADQYEVFNPENLANYDAVLFNNTTALELSENQEDAILAFVAAGKGIIGFHAAADNFRKWEEGRALIGGAFNGHPWGAGGTWAFKVEDPGHPINLAFRGEGTWIQDEIYWYRPESFQGREKLRILLSLDMKQLANHEPLIENKYKGDPAKLDVPVSWCREQGEGRVFYTNLGHRKETFMNQVCLQHMLDGIQYALGDLEASAVPSAMAQDGIKIVHAPEIVVKEVVIPETIDEVYELFPNILTNRSSWKLSASHGERSLDRSVDGDRTTRYSTGESRKEGMWVQIEFPSPTEVSGILLECLASKGDYPPRYRVVVSDDGETWGAPVARGEGAAWTEIEFPPVTTRFIRIFMDETRGGFWSIHEMEVLGAE